MMQFSEEERQKYFGGFVTIGGPWLGANKPLAWMTGYSAFNFGTEPFIVNKTLENYPVNYALSPKDTYERFSDSSWVKKTED